MRYYNVPPWGSGSGWRRGEGLPPEQMRVSDEERREIADALSQHFADGRLDHAEFDERMGKAMAAKTRGDLSGLLVDLPPLTAPNEDLPRRRSGAARTLLLAVAAFAFFSAASSWMWHPWGPHGWPWRPDVPLVVLALVAMLVFRRSRASWRYRQDSSARR